MRSFVAILLVAICALGGCSKRRTSHANDKLYLAQIQQLANADIPADVDEALAHGDTRPIGIMSDGLAVPAFNIESFRASPDTVRILPNTTSETESSVHADLQEYAFDYAKRYNRILEKKLAQTRPASMPATRSGGQ